MQHAFYAGTKAMWYDEIVEVTKIKPVVGRDVDATERVHTVGLHGRKVRVWAREKKRVAWDDGVEVQICRYKRHDGPDFPAFPAGDIPGYGGVLEERDEQSLLAASASNGASVCGLLDDLVTGELPLTELLDRC